MTAAVANLWAGSYAVPAVYSFPLPPARPLQVAVANTPGDWMFAVVTWRQPESGAGVTVSVSDDAHNWWEPLGAPSGDSNPAGVVRCAVWAAPAARAASNVQACATGPYIAIACQVFDVTGILPWMSATVVHTTWANAATALTLGTPAPSASALLFSAAGSDNLSYTMTGPGSGWSAQNIVTGNNGTDHTSDIQLTTCYQVTSSAVTSNWTSSGSQDMAGIIAGVLVSAPAPTQPNPMWPVVVTEIAPGSGAQTPPSQLSWTALSPRSLALTVQQGRQYTLSQLQAGQGTLTLDNPDGALIPPGTGSYAGIDSGTPLRQRVIWAGGAWQVQFTGDGVTATPRITTGAIFPVSPGATYTAAAWLACSAPYASGCQVIINWFTSGFTFISSSSGALVTGTTAALSSASGTAPPTAAHASVYIQANGTPASTIVFTAAAAPALAGALTATPGITWTGQDNATVTTLAPWAADPRGAPVATPNNVAYSGYMKRWPFALPGDMLRGQSQCEITDVWGYAAGILNSMAIEEILLDSPYALWPLNDPAGSTAGSNTAPGNSSPLTLVQSKYGTGGATVTWGGNTSSGLTGAASAKITASGKTGGASGMFGQVLAGNSLDTNGYGYALVCADGNYPPISGGVTIEAWFVITTGSAGNLPFTAVTTGSLFNTSFTTYTNGTPVVLSVAPGFSLPGGFSAGTVYYVVGVSGSNFQLSATLGGSAITVTSNGAGYIEVTTPWNPVIFSARGIKGPIAEIDVRTSDGAILLLYQTASGTRNTVVIDNTHDYRVVPGMTYVALAFNSTSYRVTVGAYGVATYSGSFSSALPASFAELNFAGIQDRGIQGYAWSGYLTLAAVTPQMLANSRVYSHYLTAADGATFDDACDRIERIIEYAGLTGRRWIGQDTEQSDEGNWTVSGQDIGGQAAASSASNIAASTVPAMIYVAPTGDQVYLPKTFAWNQPVRWTLGDSAAAGEIPFLPAQFSTDYDPARVVNDIQLTQLDTQTVTIPSGVMASTTMAAVETASENQYGDQPYQVTGYLTFDATASYTAGASLADLANWIADVYAQPRNRVQAVTVDASRHPSAWQFWAAASVGDMVAVNVRPPTAATSPLISLAARITQTQRSMQFSQDGVSGTIACVLDFAPEYNALICDDPVRGLLNGTNVLAW